MASFMTHVAYEGVEMGIRIMQIIEELKKLERKEEALVIDYILGNDFGKVKGYHGAGGRLPDLRLWDESGEFLRKKINDGKQKCKEGGVFCGTRVKIKELATYTLFSANRDSICIAWTALGLLKHNAPNVYEFHPGNWAYMCDEAGYNSTKQVGSWYYADQVIPGIPNPGDSYCLWLDVHGRNPTTGFQVHWPEMNPARRVLDDFEYYCKNQAVFNFRSEKDPSEIVLFDHDHQHKPLNTSESIDPAIPDASHNTHNDYEENEEHNEHRKRLDTGLSKAKQVVKSHRLEHTASKLCNRTLNAWGPSFVSYTEQKFCYMPTKTLYPFCDKEDKLPCWNDKINKVIVNGIVANSPILKRASANDSAGYDEIPDLSDIEEPIIWGRAETAFHPTFDVLISVFVPVGIVLAVLFYLLKSKRRSLKGDKGGEEGDEKDRLI